jgi:hypothetical protein
MVRRDGERFGPGDSVVLDGQSFHDCDFRGSQAVYRGGDLPEFHNCQLTQVNWHLEGAADNTLVFLRFLFTTGNQGLVNEIIKSLRGDATLS